mgnify:CR=1 FL=1
MSWNYRVILHDEDANKENCWYAIHEVYYERNNKTIAMWSSNPATVICTKDEKISDILEIMEQAAGRPILKMSKLEKKNNGEKE